MLGKKLIKYSCDGPVKFFCGVELGDNDKQDCTRKEEKNDAHYQVREKKKLWRVDK